MSKNEEGIINPEDYHFFKDLLINMFENSKSTNTLSFLLELNNKLIWNFGNKVDAVFSIESFSDKERFEMIKKINTEYQNIKLKIDCLWEEQRIEIPIEKKIGSRKVREIGE